MNTKVTLGVVVIGSLLAGLILSRLIYPYDIGVREACVWHPALFSAHLKNPYSLVTQPPFAVAPYGYFYYLIVGIGIRLFGYQFWFGRVLSVASALVCLVCIWRITWLLTRRREAAGVAAFAWASSFSVQYWIAIQRPDFTALAFALAGIVLALESDDQADRVNLRSCLAVIFLTAAFFCKLTVVLPIAVALAVYAQSRRFREGIFVAVGVICLVALVTAALDLTSGSQFTWQYFVLTRKIPVDYGQANIMLRYLLLTPSMWAFLLVILAYVAREGYALGRRGWRAVLRSSVTSRELLMVGYLVASAVGAYMASARAGAGYNYYLEATTAASIVVGLAVGHFSSAAKSQRVLAAVAALFILTGLFRLSHEAIREYYRWSSYPYFSEVIDVLRKSAGRSGASSEIGLSLFPELITFAGLEYHFGDWVQYTDGRSEVLAEIFQKALLSGRYAAVISMGNGPLPGYHLAQTKLPPPSKFPPVYLYLRDP